MLTMPVLVPLAAIVFAQPATEGVVLRAKPEAGQTYRYDIKARFSLGRDEGAAQTLKQEARLRFTVAEIGEGGVATVRAAFESLKVTLRPQGEGATPATFTWTQGEHPAEPAKVPEAADPLRAMYSELASTFLQFQVGPDGTLQKVEGFDGVLQAGAKANLPSPERTLGLFSPEAAQANLGAIWALDPSGTPRQSGQSWTTSRPVPITPTHTATSETRWTLKGVDGGVAEAAGEARVALDPKARPASEAEPTLAISEQSGTSTAKWDAKAGRLVSRTAETRLVWTATLNLKEPLVSKRTTTSRVEITLVGSE